MPKSISHSEAEALANRINEACVDKVLAWGAAINRAESCPDGAAKKHAEVMARAAGEDLMMLAVRLARTLRP